MCPTFITSHMQSHLSVSVSQSFTQMVHRFQEMFRCPPGGGTELQVSPLQNLTTTLLRFIIISPVRLVNDCSAFSSVSAGRESVLRGQKYHKVTACQWLLSCVCCKSHTSGCTSSQRITLFAAKQPAMWCCSADPCQCVSCQRVSCTHQ